MIYRSTTNAFYFIRLAVLNTMLLRTSVPYYTMMCLLWFLEFPQITLLISVSAKKTAFTESQTANWWLTAVPRKIYSHICICACRVFSPSCAITHFNLHHSLSFFPCTDKFCTMSKVSTQNNSLTRKWHSKFPCMMTNGKIIYCT